MLIPKKDENHWNRMAMAAVTETGLPGKRESEVESNISNPESRAGPTSSRRKSGEAFPSLSLSDWELGSDVKLDLLELISLRSSTNFLSITICNW